MKRIRDAKTGEFISREEAEQRDKSTWVEETMPEHEDTLEYIYEEIEKFCFVLPNTSESLVSLRDVKNVFASHGVEFD